MDRNTGEPKKGFYKYENFSFVFSKTFPLSFCNKDVRVLGHKALPRQGQVNLLATLVSFHCGFLWIAHKGHYG